MGSYQKTELLGLELPEMPSVPGIPAVFDDTTLAFSLGITARTLWWLLLCNSVKYAGTGKSQYDIFRIPKGGRKGGVRIISAPKERLKAVQRAILVHFINPIPPPGDHIGAYVLGRDLKFTASQHVGNATKISMDIKDFFSWVRRSDVRAWLQSLGYNEFVVSALSSLVTIPVMTPKGSAVSVLPQGSPTSGAVANHVAHRLFDAPVLAYLKERDPRWVYTRYSDNIEISHPKDIPREDVDRVLYAVKEIINKANFRVNHKKTDVQRAASPKRSQRVLGMTTNEKLNIPADVYRRLRATVHNCVVHGAESQASRAGKPNGAALVTSLGAQLNYWEGVAPEKIRPLKEKLSSVASTMCLE